MTDWIITLPKTIKWTDYEKELEIVRYGFQDMYYRLPGRVYAELGDRCFVTHNGVVRGWMKVMAIWNYPHGFVCSTTAIRWGGGWYLHRSGEFHYVNGVFPFPGFRGIRRYPDGAQVAPMLPNA